MNSNSLKSNPFANLFDNINEVENFLPPSTSKRQQELNIGKENTFFERVFQLTLRDNFSCDNEQPLYGCTFMGEDGDELFLNKENIDEILLQRIMITDADELKSRQRPKSSSNNLYSKQFNYLFECYSRLNKLKSLPDTESTLYEFTSNLIINMCRTLLNIYDDFVHVDLSKPSLIDHNYYSNENAMQSNDLCIQLIYLVLKQNNSDENNSFNLIVEKFYDSFINLFEDNDKIRNFFTSNNNSDNFDDCFDDKIELQFLQRLFDYLNKYFINTNQCEDYSIDFTKTISLIKFLTKSKLMKYIFIQNSFVSLSNQSNMGRTWQVNTLIGKLLSPHSLPLTINLNNSQTTEYKYFKTPSQLTKRDVELTEQSIWQTQALIKSEIRSFFCDHLIKQNSNVRIRGQWLKWLSQSLEANSKKMQEWNHYSQQGLQSMLQSLNFASDGFFLNLLDLFLDFSMPFCKSLNSLSKLTKINISYTNMKQNFYNPNETSLIPNDEPNRQIDEEFNFITECYYATNNLIRLGYLNLYQKILKLNQELSRWQQTYQDLMSGGSINDPHMLRLKTMFENMTIEFLNLKAVLLEEDLVRKMSKFLCFSSSWLSYLAINDFTSNISNEHGEFLLDNISKLKQFNYSLLKKIPEYLITNVVEFFSFLSKFKDSVVIDLFLPNNNDNDISSLNSIINLVLIYMGNSKLLFNPHCRAQLAEALESLIPKKNSSSSSMFDYVAMNRKKLAYYAFANHPCSSYLCESLLNVFVSIEMTGQSVQFEQKFNYRRPMYELLEFLWSMPNTYSNESEEFCDKNLLNQHRKKLDLLAKEAYENIESSEQPLFLKFLNFLINDANYLLIEGLLYLEKIKQSQDKLAQDDLEKTLNNAQRAELESSLKHMIMLAKFHNFMSMKTIQTIKMLTTSIKRIFCHDVLVDRIATMLNDFLLHLVGKKKRKQLKVKNFDEVEFKPKEVVSIICDIYLNLSSEHRFCQAICQDGRSYSKDLFDSAIEILEQINRDYEMIDRFRKLAENVEEIARLQKIEDENFEDAPEEYLDPIMSILMNDPVILPNSKKIVDRSTIARHLLSDQSDPFNRSPLTLQEVIPADDLRKEIEAWKSSKKSSN